MEELKGGWIFMGTTLTRHCENALKTTLEEMAKPIGIDEYVFARRE